MRWIEPSVSTNDPVTLPLEFRIFSDTAFGFGVIGETEAVLLIRTTVAGDVDEFSTPPPRNSRKALATPSAVAFNPIVIPVPVSVLAGV